MTGILLGRYGPVRSIFGGCLLFLAFVLFGVERAQLFEDRGIVTHRALARLARVGAVFADRELGQVFGGLVERHQALGMKRNTMASRVDDAPSNSRVCRMAPVDSLLHASTHNPQNMHLPMSMSKRLIICFFVAGSLVRSMAMTSMGQARSQRLQPVQMSICTSRRPR